MDAKLRPLEGKYYGTEVEVFDDDGNSAGVIQVWLNPRQEQDFAPSNRELHAHVAMVARDLGGIDNATPEDLEYEICDSHYETRLSHAISQLLVETIKSYDRFNKLRMEAKE
jgi:hypothetical protein